MALAELFAAPGVSLAAEIREKLLLAK